VFRRLWAGALGLIPVVAFGAAAEPSAAPPPVDGMGALWAWWGVGLASALAALFFAIFFFKWLMRKSEGDALMREIAGHVREGAYAYLRRQYASSPSSSPSSSSSWPSSPSG